MMPAISSYTRCAERLDENDLESKPNLSDQLHANATPSPPLQSGSKLIIVTVEVF